MWITLHRPCIIHSVKNSKCLGERSSPNGVGTRLSDWRRAPGGEAGRLHGPRGRGGAAPRAPGERWGGSTGPRGREVGRLHGPPQHWPLALVGGLLRFLQLLQRGGQPFLGAVKLLLHQLDAPVQGGHLSLGLQGRGRERRGGESTGGQGAGHATELESSVWERGGQGVPKHYQLKSNQLDMLAVRRRETFLPPPPPPPIKHYVHVKKETAKQKIIVGHWAESQHLGNF